jgi:hypothetical protein
MQNPATQSQDELNAFTTAVKKGDGNIRVRLRNGNIVQPTFYFGIDVEGDGFEVVAIEWTIKNCRENCWYLDGSGVNNSDFDMMEIVA